MLEPNYSKHIKKPDPVYLLVREDLDGIRYYWTEKSEWSDDPFSSKYFSSRKNCEAELVALIHPDLNLLVLEYGP